jgi:hypothetical protein
MEEFSVSRFMAILIELSNKGDGTVRNVTGMEQTNTRIIYPLKAFPLQAWTGPSRRLRLQNF